MELQLVWQTRQKWGRILLIVFLVCGYFYLTKTSRSAVQPIEAYLSSRRAVSNASTGSLSLLTYNVAGLPDVISAATTPRAQSMRAISKKINTFDIVNVQEDFHYHDDLYKGGNRHPYRTAPKIGMPYGDGLNTLSNYPILESRRISWKDCHGTDCLASKGFSYTRIQLAVDVNIDVYNVHATAQDNAGAALARRKNMQQLADYIRQYSNDQAVLVMGDFNAHYAASWDNVLRFSERTTLTDAWVALERNGTVPPIHPQFRAADKLALTDTCESIDKIFFRNSLHVEFTPRSYKVEKQQFSDNHGEPLSDHCAISFVLNWKKK
ncbi:endonuclease/exonuclease/phosphatase family protein [Sphingobacterium suaedae]|uniref:Endonuclease/exonuclease/phosphatase family protein n=1 Tax=Sphingobacterium suaedae TaxID=1686402 RepID=A0ABW5KIM2_9SPHI